MRSQYLIQTAWIACRSAISLAERPAVLTVGGATLFEVDGGFEVVLVADGVEVDGFGAEEAVTDDGVTGGAGRRSRLCRGAAVRRIRRTQRIGRRLWHSRAADGQTRRRRALPGGGRRAPGDKRTADQQGRAGGDPSRMPRRSGLPANRHRKTLTLLLPISRVLSTARATNPANRAKSQESGSGRLRMPNSVAVSWLPPTAATPQNAWASRVCTELGCPAIGCPVSP